jgi:ABC-type polar amino acid transport system ATPase subunit
MESVATMNAPARFPTAAPSVQKLETAVAFQAVGKSYGPHRVLKNIDLEIAKGEKVVICGPSGSGKSTLIRCINALEQHDQGRIDVLGSELKHDPASERQVRMQVGMVFQSFNLFSHMTVLDNCTLALRRNAGLSRKEADTIALSFLDRVHVASQAQKYPSQLSGGQQQRVAIARALATRPKIMLFDEPTSALDPEMVKEVLQTIIELAEDGMTMAVVTHEMGFARRVADRIVFIADGEIVETGRPDEVFATPRTPRFAQFLEKIL